MIQTKVYGWHEYRENNTTSQEPQVFIHSWESEAMARAYIIGMRETSMYSKLECYIDGKEV